jgi:hypothetical protein
MHMLSDPNAVKLPQNQLANLARITVRSATEGIIAITNDGKAPTVTRVRLACRHDGTPIFQLSSELIANGGKATLVIDNESAGTLVSIQGTLGGASNETDEARYFRRQTGDGTDDPSLGLAALTVGGAQVEADDGAVRDLETSEFLLDVSEAAELSKVEPGIIEHVNGGHPDTIHAAVSQLGIGTDDWIMIGCDPEGIDVARGDRIARVPLGKVAHNQEEFKYAMIDLRVRGGGPGMPQKSEAAE